MTREQQGNFEIRKAVRLALAANLAIAGTAAAANSVGDNDTLEEIVVTGSRIVQPGLESISPMISVTPEEIKAQGTTRVEDLLNSLPQVFADQGGNISNGSTGTAAVNLRGLGVQRTLVLINGRRLMSGDPTQNSSAAPDLNQIPAALVDRVDVLTGGASAVYGADAVAGVVNFVMNDHFSGVRIDVNDSFNNHSQHDKGAQALVAAKGFKVPSNVNGDGQIKDVTFILGGNVADGKGNVTGYLGFRKVDPVLQAARDFSACTLQGGSSLSCGGSSTSATGRFFTSLGSVTVGPNSQFVPFTQRYNYGATNFYQRNDLRYDGGLFGHFTFNEHATAYTEFQFMHDESDAQIAPSGAFLSSGSGVDANGVPTGKWVLNCDNPLMSAQERAAMCGTQTTGNTQVLFGRRNVEGAPRNDDLEHNSFRFVIGTKGEINDAWHYDVYGQEGQTRYSENYQNDVSKSRLNQALLAVTDPLTGNVVCQANANGNNGAPGCVPYNIWTQGGVTPDQVAYISIPSFKSGYTEERIFSGFLSGDLTKYGVKLPTANTGLGISFGAEYRSEAMRLRPDVENQTNDLSGSGNPVLPLYGAFSVKEGFTEARLPLIQDRPGFKSLSVETGYRFSDYNLGFSTNTYKLGLDWAPTSDLRARASYQRAVRAPNLQELYLERFVGNDGSTDPCANSTSSSAPPTYTAAQCANSGVTAAQYGTIVGNTAGQYNGQFSGNPNLKPEKSDTLSFGIVLTPTALPNFTLTADYFDIKVKDVISTYGPDFTVKTCVETGNPLFCSLVHRAPGSGSLWTSPSGYIDDPTQNLGTLQTKGVDVTAAYSLNMGTKGKLAFALNGTYNMHFITEPVPGFGSYDCAGYYGRTCGVPDPKWRHKLRITWDTPVEGLGAGLQWRHINSVQVDNASSDKLLTGPVAATEARLGTRDYLDLTASYEFHKGWTARLGINNALDKDPPVIPGSSFSSIFANGNTYPQVYDTLGRYVFINVTLDFK